VKLLTLLLIIFLSSCASTKINITRCEGLNHCTTVSYWSKKDHPSGVIVRYKDLEYISNASVATSSPLEEGALQIFKKAVDQMTFGAKTE